MSVSDASSHAFTRRSFLKTTGAVAGVAAIGSLAACASPGESSKELGNTGEPVELAEEQTFINMCRGNCGGSCPLVSTVREGKIVKTVPLKPDAENRELVQGCVRGASTPQRVYSTSRVLYPMKHSGERGADSWERISWDDAIALLAEKFQGAIDEFGGQSIAMWHSFGSATKLSQSTSAFANSSPFSNRDGRMPAGGIAPERIIQALGLTVLTPSSDMAAIYMQLGLLNYPMSSWEDMANAKTILIWGANPYASFPSAGNYINRAHENGAKVITIDPVFTRSAALSDAWIPVRGGTDSALMLAMCNYIIDNDLIDYDYFRNKSVAPLLVKEDGTYLKLSDLGMEPVEVTNLKGEVVPTDSEVVYDEATGAFGSSFEVTNPAITGSFDVQGIPVRTVFDIVREQIAPFTVDFAAEECDVPKEQIEELARTYATNTPSTIHNLWGFEHFSNSFHNYFSLTLLAALTGNVNKPGASVMQFKGVSRFARPTVINSAEFLAVENAKPSFSFTGERLADVVQTGKFAGQDFPVRCLYVMNANPLSSGLGRTELIEAFKKIDFIAVADSFMTDTARYADLVLPVSLSWETEDHNGTFMMQKAVEPAGECKSDLEIFTALAEKMGMPDLYDKTGEEYLRAMLDTPENKEAGVDYDVVSKQGLVEDYEISSLTGVETNPTGRTKFYLEALPPRDDFGQTFALKDRVPYYEKATEAYPGNALMEKYPLFGMSLHDLYHAHSLHNGISWLNEIRKPFVKIHEDAAKARDIAQGDMVRVFNDRGYVVLEALVTKGIRPDTVLLPHGFESGDFVEGHSQSLTGLFLDDATSNNNYNDMLVEVAKYEGGAR